MSIIIWIILLLVSFMSVILMINLQSIKKFKKYMYFRYLSYVLIAWTIVTILRVVAIEPFFIYHLTFMIYPIVFLTTVFLYLTVKIYLGNKINKYLKILLIVFFAIDLGLSLTNSFHHLLLDINYDSAITTVAFNTASIGIFFYVHTLACYILLFLGLYELLIVFISNFKRDRDVYPFLLLSSSIVAGVVMNIIHIFFYSFTIDPTYIFIIIVATILLNIFKNRDLNLIIDANGNKDILKRIREMYIISDHKGMVVDCSENIKLKCDHFLDQNPTLTEVKKELEKSSVLYTSDSQLPDEFDSSKRYYHVKEQRIKMSHFLYFGRITLLYDETSDIKLISEMDRIMSYDLMTGLFNRNYFESQIPILESEAIHFGLIIFDVDGLKLHNDYLGHKSGDELLINFSNIMLRECNSYEGLTPIRLGGDEFLIISRNGDKDFLNQIALELTENGKSTEPVENISFSFGIATRTRSNIKFSTVLKEADANLYVMKESRKAAKVNMEEHFKSLEKNK